MDENMQLVAKDEKAMAEFVSAVAQNKALGEELRQCVTQFANLLVAMQAQMNAMQRDLQSKVTISTAQAKAIQDAVKGRSEVICSAKGLSYERSGKALRAAIYRDFCKEFAVASRHDLPANKFRSAVEFVEEWSSLSLVRRLREKEKESDAEKGNAGRCRCSRTMRFVQWYSRRGLGRTDRVQAARHDPDGYQIPDPDGYPLA